MSGISAIYILDLKGRVLITRSYKSDIPNDIAETFNKKILEFDETTITPVFIDDGITYFHKRESNLIFLLLSRGKST